MNQPRKPARVRRAITWLAVLYVILLVFPEGWRATRILAITGGVALWGGALGLAWGRTGVRVALLALPVLVLTALGFPGRTVGVAGLRDDYRRALRLYRFTPYIWGGENVFGIDCSGLVRKGLVWGQILNGLRTANGHPVRDAVTLWWHDCSARALRDGYRAQTRPLFRADSVSAIDAQRLDVGDLAVTADGVHVMVYVGDRMWTEADPGLRRVVTLTAPADNHWFNVPVVVVRWRVLDGERAGEGR